MSEKLVFYFSFRSPYSWLALYRLNLIKEVVPVEIQMIPVFPAKDKGDVVLSNRDKVKYITKDIVRITTAYGLDIKWPDPFDTDWLIAHTAYIYAEEQGKGLPFCLALYHARFLHGKDIGNEEILRDLAIANGLDAQALIEALGVRKYKKKLLQGMSSAKHAGVFGVPFFVYKDSAYWGNDRLEWLIREINKGSGVEIPDLSIDPFKRPY
jgi:2-hydroxychromene-2-carboxylate isomerase